MKRIQPVRITYRNGTIEDHSVDMFNLPSLLSQIDMDKVAGIEYGEAIVNAGPAEIRPSGVDFSYVKSENLCYLHMYDKNDRRVATAKYTPVKLQQFAVGILQQTTYRFVDVQDDHDHLKHRMDGLDK